MNSARQEIVGRLPEYRELSKVDLSWLPKEALLATIKDLAESLVALITAPDSETIRVTDSGNGPGTTHCVECGREIQEDDTGSTPYCGGCYRRFTADGFFGL